MTFTRLDDTFNISTVANTESAIGNIDTAIQTLTHNGPHWFFLKSSRTAQLATSPASQQTCKLVVVVELKMLTLQLKQQILRKHKSCSIVLQTCGSVQAFPANAMTFFF